VVCIADHEQRGLFYIGHGVWKTLRSVGWHTVAQCSKGGGAGLRHL
jgi:hypothetical protein